MCGFEIGDRFASNSGFKNVSESLGGCDTSFVVLRDRPAIGALGDRGVAIDRRWLCEIGEGAGGGSEQRGSPSGCAAPREGDGDKEEGCGRPLAGEEMRGDVVGLDTRPLCLSLSPNKRDQDEFVRCRVPLGNAEGAETAF